MSPSPFRARTFAVLFTVSASALLATACGGRSADFSGGGGGGGSGSGGGSSGGVSSSSGAGSSSGASSGSSSGSGSGSSSGVSSSSSGGQTCPGVAPTGGSCSGEGENCDYGDGNGCGVSCQCNGGQWNCFADPCIDPPPPPPVCPPVAPASNSSCAGDYGQLCDYSNGSSCSGEQCTCDGNVWTCGTLSCPPPQQCPTFPPSNQDSCTDLGDSCVYYVNGDCNEETCNCFSGVWSCSYSEGCNFEDAGVSEDAGFVHP
jgi:hypothetical protein